MNMKELPKLDHLSHEEKNVLIRKLWDKVQELEAKQEKAEKTSKNSSKPPSQGFRENKGKEEKREKKGAKRHKQGGRELDPNPDQILVAHAKVCPHCETEVSQEEQKLTGRYDRIELPPVKIMVTRVERYGGTCPCCHQKYEAPVPIGLEPGSPFGDSIAIMLVPSKFVLGLNTRSTTVKGGCNHEISEPVIVVTKTVEVFKGTKYPCLKSASLAAIGVKVPQHS
jgi:transposase